MAKLRGGGDRAIMAGSKSGAAVSPKKPTKLKPHEKRTAKGRFATHFQALLDERGWTKERFSERSGIPDATIRKWLRAASVPYDIETLEDIARAFDLPEHPLKDYRHVLPPPK